MSTRGSSGTVKSTQEQLRSDHIGTLELLQQVTKENAKLKAEVKSLRLETRGKGEESEPPTATHSDGLDLLELVEKNSKQAEEIKLLKARMNQTDIELMKLKQNQFATQQKVSQTVADKAKKKEDDMEHAIYELETQLKTANEELKLYYTLHVQISELQALNGVLNQKCSELTRTNSEYSNETSNLVNTVESLKNQISSMQLQLDNQIDQKLRDDQHQFAHLTEQNVILKKELSAQVENAYQLQQLNDRLNSEISYSRGVNAELQTSTNFFSDVVAQQKEHILSLQTELEAQQGNNNTSSTTFAFTAPVQPPVVVPVAAPLPVPVPVEQIKISSDDQDPSFRFQEFLRLKRENKELKMRLADMGAAPASGTHNSGSAPLMAPHTIETAAIKSANGNGSSKGPTGPSPRGASKKLPPTGTGLPARAARGSASQKVI